METLARRNLILGASGGLILAGGAAERVNAAGKSVGQKWIDGWNSTDPEVLVAAFTPNGIYEDVAFGLKKKGAPNCATSTSFFTSLSAGCM